MFTALYVLHSTFCPHSVFMCVVWIWEQTAIISLYSIDWLVFITETDCVYCAVRSTLYVLPAQCFCVDLRTNSNYFTVSIDWLVFVIKAECIYCAVRSAFYVLPRQCVYVFCVELRTNSDYFTVQHWLVGFITETDCVYCAVRSTFFPHSVFMCFVWIWEQTAIISLYSIDWLVFVTETECVYCAVRSTFFPHSVFMCFVWICELTAIISL